MPAGFAPVYQQFTPVGDTSLSGWNGVPTGSPRVQAPVVAVEVPASSAQVAVSKVSFARIAVCVPVCTLMELVSSGQLTPVSVVVSERSISVPQPTEGAMEILYGVAEGALCSAGRS